MRVHLGRYLGLPRHLRRRRRRCSRGRGGRRSRRCLRWRGRCLGGRGWGRRLRRGRWRRTPRGRARRRRGRGGGGDWRGHSWRRRRCRGTRRRRRKGRRLRARAWRRRRGSRWGGRRSPRSLRCRCRGRRCGCLAGTSGVALPGRLHSSPDVSYRAHEGLGAPGVARVFRGLDGPHQPLDAVTPVSFFPDRAGHFEGEGHIGRVSGLRFGHAHRGRGHWSFLGAPLVAQERHYHCKPDAVSGTSVSVRPWFIAPSMSYKTPWMGPVRAKGDRSSDQQHGHSRDPRRASHPVAAHRTVHFV
jgi:hypothetical protein